MYTIYRSCSDCLPNKHSLNKLSYIGFVQGVSYFEVYIYKDGELVSALDLQKRKRGRGQARPTKTLKTSQYRCAALIFSSSDLKL